MLKNKMQQIACVILITCYNKYVRIDLKTECADKNACILQKQIRYFWSLIRTGTPFSRL